MVPLQFWFCRNPGLALPLIALQYHEVKLKFTWGTSTNVGRDGNAAVPTCEVWGDYIYLDTDERRRFAQVSHEYLIEQVQREAVDADKTSLKLNFNHPVKELIWTSGSNTAWTTQKALNSGSMVMIVLLNKIANTSRFANHLIATPRSRIQC